MKRLTGFLILALTFSIATAEEVFEKLTIDGKEYLNVWVQPADPIKGTEEAIAMLLDTDLMHLPESLLN